MKKETWLGSHTPDLKGKTVVLTGATGGLGSAVSRYVLSFGGRLIMVNRSKEKSEALMASLRQDYPQGDISYLLADLSHMAEVKALCGCLQNEPIDVLMLNAGTYAIPRALSPEGYDTVFETNFLSQYYMVRTLLPLLNQRKAKVVVTGSIAHRFNSSDMGDVDFAHHQGANNIYGNSKRFLMFALTELLKNQEASLSLAHPGISFTGITSHYPEKLLKIVKLPMKTLFMAPQKACRSMVRGILEDVPYLHWIGPRFFDIWGYPTVKALTSCEAQERRQIFNAAEDIYKKL